VCGADEVEPERAEFRIQGLEFRVTVQGLKFRV
jgi:hypothetical protein